MSSAETSFRLWWAEWHGQRPHNYFHHSKLSCRIYESIYVIAGKKYLNKAFRKKKRTVKLLNKGVWTLSIRSAVSILLTSKRFTVFGLRTQTLRSLSPLQTKYHLLPYERQIALKLQLGKSAPFYLKPLVKLQNCSIRRLLPNTWEMLHAPRWAAVVLLVISPNPLISGGKCILRCTIEIFSTLAFTLPQ